MSCYRYHRLVHRPQLMYLCSRLSQFLRLAVALGLLLFAQDSCAQPLSVRDNENQRVPPLSFHRRNYVVSSLNQTDSIKFQLSLKYRVLSFPWGKRHRQHPSAGVYFAFTQLAVWDAFDLENSSPMKDVNFGPEVFYRQSFADIREEGCNFHDIQVGASHNSNGRRAPETRSVNLIVGTARAGCSLARRSGPLGAIPHGVLELSAWSPPIVAFENPDITRYMGYGRLRLTLASGIVDVEQSTPAATAGIFGSVTTLQVGTAGYVTLQWEGSYRPPYPYALRFLPYFMVQYFNGYGETLLSYNQKSQNFRIGLGF